MFSPVGVSSGQDVHAGEVHVVILMEDLSPSPSVECADLAGDRLAYPWLGLEGEKSGWHSSL